jgi:hypothetical protein
MNHREEKFEERAAIMEYEAGMPRLKAEGIAWVLTYGRAAKVQYEKEYIEERTAILEFDGGLTRPKAENLACMLWLQAATSLKDLSGVVGLVFAEEEERTT